MYISTRHGLNLSLSQIACYAAAEVDHFRLGRNSDFTNLDQVINLLDEWGETSVGTSELPCPTFIRSMNQFFQKCELLTNATRVQEVVDTYQILIGSLWSFRSRLNGQNPPDDDALTYFVHLLIELSKTGQQLERQYYSRGQYFLAA